MKVDPIILAIIAVALVAFVVFIIIRNKKDKDDFVKELNAEKDLSTINNDDLDR